MQIQQILLMNEKLYNNLKLTNEYLDEKIACADRFHQEEHINQISAIQQQLLVVICYENV